ncbi:MAG: aminotransferase class I/II-fold pyridoxal phosphate-dependent enzyme [Bryobacterales bacterium]|nr:aminotransferase class I/II-fold pyridoxal phosphate-dependent enzyme [Bryobacterales bacterium]
MSTVDLRSDTVTRPTPAMRRAMHDAEVGDDVFGEDPTVNALERRAAELVGKEAAVFVPSGTMGNQIAVAVHTSPGQEVICEENSHIVLYEMGMLARFSGCLARSIPAADGRLDWESIRPRVRRPSDHFRGTGLIALENTHNQAGGRVYSMAALREIRSRSAESGIPVHMDGARVFHAAAALDVSVAEIGATVDSLTFCLSKGLGAPVGSLLTGTREFIGEARLVRKALGGGMRQAGVLAAAGLVALDQSPVNIPAAHENARFLAEALAEVPGMAVAPGNVETNILFADISGTGLSNSGFTAALCASGVLVLALAPGRVRMVTHQDVDRAGCERAVRAIRDACSRAGRVN